MARRLVRRLVRVLLGVAAGTLFALLVVRYSLTVPTIPVSTNGSQYTRQAVFERNVSIPGPKYSGPYNRFKQHDGSWTRASGISDAVFKYYDSDQPPTGIPHIIHQVWDTANIPEHFVPWVLSWVTRHPNWEYWLWTLADVTEFIQKDYPECMDIYERYNLTLSRTDAMRYFVLHSYGGVYSDLDTECLKPLDNLLLDLPCVLSEETYEHAHLLYSRDPANIMTTIMACRPTHPLFLLAIQGLSRAQKKFPGDAVLNSTGPFYIDSTYREFLERVPIKPATRVKVFSPEYLLPTYDEGQHAWFQNVCNQIKKSSPAFMRNTCKLWKAYRHSHNIPSNISYATHHWIHVIMDEKRWKGMKSFPVEDVMNMIAHNSFT